MPHAKRLPAFLIAGAALCGAFTLSALAGHAEPAAPEPVSVALAEVVSIIPDGDGYGLTDCFQDGRECGSIVASAWCESQGLGVPDGYARTERGVAVRCLRR